MELLRGVEFGIETKALLFKRMCAYAGLHAIVIKGFCKAKDYKPAEEFVDNRWRNAWNAVYVAGGWRLLQPNWAAMQVNTKVIPWNRPLTSAFLTFDSLLNLQPSLITIVRSLLLSVSSGNP